MGDKYVRTYHFVKDKKESLTAEAHKDWLEALEYATGDIAVIVSHVNAKPQIISGADVRDELIEFGCYCSGRYFENLREGAREQHQAWVRDQLKIKKPVCSAVWGIVANDVFNFLVHDKTGRAVEGARNAYYRSIRADTTPYFSEKTLQLGEQFEFEQRLARERIIADEKRRMTEALETLIGEMVGWCRDEMD